MSNKPVFFDNTKYTEKLKNISCVNPFIGYQLGPDGVVGNCCYSWLPTMCGNLFDRSLLEIMNDPLTKDIQCSTTDGSFKYCNAEVCPGLVEYIHKGTLSGAIIEKSALPALDKKDLTLYFDYDSSCNLYCGSCRNERVLYSVENLPENLRKLHNIVKRNLQSLLVNGYKLTVHATGSGDPFASVLYWDYLKNIKEEDEVTVGLATNGTLMTKERFDYPYADKIHYINISIDAFTEETYKVVRRGGNFKALKKNLSDLDEMLKNGRFKKLKYWRPFFVVQESNFHEMADFARWLVKFETVDFVWFNLIAQWDHISDAEFAKKAIWQKSHPRHQEFLNILVSPIFDNPKIFLGNMAQYRDNLSYAPADSI